MFDKPQGTDRTKGEEHKADQPSGKSPDPILKKLRYPKTSIRLCLDQIEQPPHIGMFLFKDFE